MTDDEIKAFLKPKPPALTIAQFVLAAVGVAITVGAVFVAIGKNQAAIDDIRTLRDQRQSDHDDITSIRYEAKSANAGVQRVEQKVDDGLKDINNQLRQLRVHPR